MRYWIENVVALVSLGFLLVVVGVVAWSLAVLWGPFFKQADGE